MSELHFHSRSILLGTLFDIKDSNEVSVERFVIDHLKKHFIRCKRDLDSNSLLMSVSLLPPTYLFDETRQFSFLEWESYIKACNSVEELLEKAQNYLIIDYHSIIFRKVVNKFSKLSWVEIESYYYKQVVKGFNDIKNINRIEKASVSFYQRLTSINLSMDALTFEYNQFIQNKMEIN